LAPALDTEGELGELLVLGAGWHALDIAEYAEDCGWRVTGLVELLDDARVGGTHGGRPIVGMDDLTPETVVIAAGGADRRSDRRAAWNAASERGVRTTTICHPTAHVSPTARLAPGAIVGPMAVIGAGASIGEHVLVSRGGLVGHHVEVGAFTRLLPGVNVAGHVHFGTDVTVGMGATITEHTEVGDFAIVAAGAMVLRDVEPGVRVQGVPARPFAPVG
jgi:sugar O-acyltransferase (sialic acid O-acetyltransferase NeuD family)